MEIIIELLHYFRPMRTNREFVVGECLVAVLSSHDCENAQNKETKIR